MKSRVRTAPAVHTMLMAASIASVLQATGALTAERIRVRKRRFDIQASECPNGIHLSARGSFAKLFRMKRSLFSLHCTLNNVDHTNQICNHHISMTCTADHTAHCPLLP